MALSRWRLFLVNRIGLLPIVRYEINILRRCPQTPRNCLYLANVTMPSNPYRSQRRNRGPSGPRFRALALFRRLSWERVDHFVMQASEKPAQRRASQKERRAQRSLGIQPITQFAEINSLAAASGFRKRTAASRVKHRAHADLCVNLPCCPQTKRAPVPRWPSVPRGERHSRL